MYQYSGSGSERVETLQPRSLGYSEWLWGFDGGAVGGGNMILGSDASVNPPA